MLEFRLLGPVEVYEDDRAVALPGRKARAVLAALLLRAGEEVSGDRLIEDIWGEQPPSTARNSLHNHVSALRKALGPELVTTGASGYALRAPDEQVDLARFRKLVERAHAEAADETRAAALREALALWRGPALADLAYEPLGLLEAPRLEELRLAAQADLIDAELALGRHADVLAELEPLVEAHPFDERLRGQLMLALYRSGRQAEALDAYAETRRFLVDELGLEPSQPLRDLQQALLRQDDSLLPPAPERPGAEVLPARRTVTAVCAELFDSTALDELDPEALGRLLEHAFAVAREVVQRHGGTVEKLAGDAVLAVFGVPSAHEDDALRSLRSALELRDALGALGAGLEPRVGVNTGEVFAGGDRTGALVAGVAVNVARRIQESAAPGEIVLGASTYVLVREAARCEAAGAIPLGSGEARTWRLQELIEGAPAIPRRFGAPLVGRDDELAELRRAFDATATERGCRVVVLTGEPGIGKTRLAAELCSQLGDSATVLVGQCVSYGEGATWLPLAEALRHALGEQVEEAAAELLAADADGDRAATTIAGLVAGVTPSGSTVDAFWALRRLLEQLAADRSVVLVLEDVHLAEPTLLDFVEHLEGFAGSAPILVLCVARPELLEERSGWAERALALGRLARDDVGALLANLDDELDEARRVRVTDAAEGNPLLAEQLLAWAAEGGQLDVLPPSVEALLQSRIDLLSGDERAVLERASVVGRDCPIAAARALTPPESVGAMRDALFALVRKGLLEPAPAASRHEDGFRFHHVLVREAAYAGIPKAMRAGLHEQTAEWLDTEGSAQDEVVGYHLEQAYRYRAEIGPIDRHTRGLAADAGLRLGDAGLRAWKRGDVAAALNLLTRATSLLPDPDERRRELMCELGVAYRASGDLDRATEVLTQAIDAALAARDRRVQLRAEVERGDIELLTDPGSGVDEFLTLAAAAIPAFEAVEDDRSLGRTWLLVGFVHGGFRCQNAAWADASERALVHYVRSGWPPSMAVSGLAAALYHGPTPVPEGIERCRRLLDGTQERGTRANVQAVLAGFEALRGNFAAARELVDGAAETLDTLGQLVQGRHAAGWMRAQIALLAENPGEAVTLLREHCDFFRATAHTSLLATSAAELAEAFYERGQDDEAIEWSRVSESHAGEADIGAQYLWRGVRAKLLARAGDAGLGETLAREALALVERTDAVNQHARLLVDLAAVLRIGGGGDPAEPLAEALALYEAKGNLVGAKRTRSLLGELARA